MVTSERAAVYGSRPTGAEEGSPKELLTCRSGFSGCAIHSRRCAGVNASPGNSKQVPMKDWSASDHSIRYVYLLSIEFLRLFYGLFYLPNLVTLGHLLILAVRLDVNPRLTNPRNFENMVASLHSALAKYFSTDSEKVFEVNILWISEPFKLLIVLPRLLH